MTALPAMYFFPASSGPSLNHALVLLLATIRLSCLLLPNNSALSTWVRSQLRLSVSGMLVHPRIFCRGLALDLVPFFVKGCATTCTGLPVLSGVYCASVGGRSASA